MTTKQRAEELADWVEFAYFGFSKANEITELLRTIPALEAKIEKHNRQLEAAKKLEYQKGFEFGSNLTHYNKPRLEALEAEIERLKKSMCQKLQEEAAYCYDNGDYMIDYADCQSIIKGTWERPDYNFGIKNELKPLGMGN